MFTVYLWIDGREFDAARFRESLPGDIRGTVEARKRMQNGIAEVYQHYWKSTPRMSSENPAAPLASELQVYRQWLTKARAEGATRVVAQIVGTFSSVDDVRGVYLFEDVVRLLSECGVSLDVDLVRKL